MTAKRIMFAMTWLGGAALAAWISARVNPLGYTGGRARDEEQRLRRNSSSLAAMFGEFRTSLSDIMFIKTERYLHAGVGYLPHHDESVLSAGDLSAEVDEHQSMVGAPEEALAEHSGHPTLIPARAGDFRGFVGVLHRQVKPWRDPSSPHVHTDGRELLPWFRVMTRSDPHYVRGYVAGGFWLQEEEPDLALGFIEEGLRNNPDEFQLYVSRGFLRVRQARRMAAAGGGAPAADAILEAARDDFLRGAELMQRVRPEAVSADGAGPGGWDGYRESDALAAANMAVMLTRQLGDMDRARSLARRFLPFFPDSGPLLNAIQ